MGWSFSDFVSLGKSTYQNTKPVADALIGGMIGQPMANTPTISAQGTFANTQKWYQTDLAKDIGGALVSHALQGKPQAPMLQYSTQTETNDANLMLMRQRAEEAGFNPLTVLRAGGINAYATRKTNIPSYAPQLSRGPSYLAIAAGATAMSYFNRPSEQQKATTALKTAQAFADLDYTRAMTDQARSSGDEYSMDGTNIGGVIFHDLPPGAEPYLGTDGSHYRDADTHKYMFKGDGFTSGSNWTTSIPANVRYTINVDGVNPKTHSTISEQFASIADVSDLPIATALHSSAAGKEAIEPLLPPMAVFDNFFDWVPTVTHKGVPLFD